MFQFVQSAVRSTFVSVSFPCARKILEKSLESETLGNVTLQEIEKAAEEGRLEDIFGDDVIDMSPEEAAEFQRMTSAAAEAALDRDDGNAGQVSGADPTATGAEPATEPGASSNEGAPLHTAGSSIAAEPQTVLKGEAAHTAAEHHSGHTSTGPDADAGTSASGRADAVKDAVSLAADMQAGKLPATRIGAALPSQPTHGSTTEAATPQTQSAVNAQPASGPAANAASQQAQTAVEGSAPAAAPEPAPQAASPALARMYQQPAGPAMPPPKANTESPEWQPVSAAEAAPQSAAMDVFLAKYTLETLAIQREEAARQAALGETGWDPTIPQDWQSEIARVRHMSIPLNRSNCNGFSLGTKTGDKTKWCESCFIYCGAHPDSPTLCRSSGRSLAVGCRSKPQARQGRICCARQARLLRGRGGNPTARWRGPRTVSGAKPASETQTLISSTGLQQCLQHQRQSQRYSPTQRHLARLSAGRTTSISRPILALTSTCGHQAHMCMVSFQSRMCSGQALVARKCTMTVFHDRHREAIETALRQGVSAADLKRMIDDAAAGTPPAQAETAGVRDRSQQQPHQQQGSQRPLPPWQQTTPAARRRRQPVSRQSPFGRPAGPGVSR